MNDQKNEYLQLYEIKIAKTKLNRYKTNLMSGSSELLGKAGALKPETLTVGHGFLHQGILTVGESSVQVTS